MFEMLNFIFFTDCGGKPADVYFLLDSSSSIWIVDFKKQIQFVKEVVDLFEIGQSKTRIGVSTFSDKYEAVIHLNDFAVKTALKAAIDKVPYLRGGTDTAAALRHVREEEFEGVARKEVTEAFKIPFLLQDQISPVISDNSFRTFTLIIKLLFIREIRYVHY